jgi:hypothetical protein
MSPEPPCDNRFEALKGDKEVLTKHRNTKAAPSIGNYASRFELWG